MINPIPEVLNDDLFEKLRKLDILNEKKMRDFEIRFKYRKLKPHMTTLEAIQRLRYDYPYLQYETIRKIIYSIPKVSELS